MRRLSVGVAFVCLTLGTLCFGIFFVQAAGIVIHMPSVDEALAQIGIIQRWGWYCLSLYVAGSAILFLAGTGRAAQQRE